MSQFKANPNFTPDLYQQAELASAVKQKGEEVLSAAQANADAVSQSGVTSSHIESKFTRGKQGRPHFYVALRDNDKGSAAAIEFGTSKTSPFRILGRAIRKVG